MVEAQCEQCKRVYKTHAAWLRKRKLHFCGRPCKAAWQSYNVRGEKHPGFKRGSKNYITIHSWLARTYGKAFRCEDTRCTKESTRFVWAKRRGKGYEREKKNFIQLCYRCHFRYDFNETWRKNMILGQARRNGHLNENNMPITEIGKKIAQAMQEPPVPKRKDGGSDMRRVKPAARRMM